MGSECPVVISSSDCHQLKFLNTRVCHLLNQVILFNLSLVIINMVLMVSKFFPLLIFIKLALLFILYFYYNYIWEDIIYLIFTSGGFKIQIFLGSLS